MPKTHEIVKQGRDFYATGLTRDETLQKYFPARTDVPGEWLHVGADAPETWAELYAASYDAHQMFGGWETDDLLSYNGVVFARIESFHVVAQKSELLPDKAAFQNTRLES